MELKKSLKKVLALCLVALSAVTLVSCGGDSTKEVVKVYNWGDYIAEEVNDLFEAETGIKVVYDMFETNEDMYLKIKNSGGSSYDVVIPSDYMIKKMINEGMLAEINFENIPNASGIDGRFLGLGYDPDDVYSVPYVWGTVCICYNKNMVDEPVDSWNILWDEKYEKQIYMMNSERDSIAVALLSLGYSINTKDEAELEEAKAKLLEQKPLLITYTLDDAKDKMLGQSGALAVMWSCDVGIVMNELAEMDEDYLEFAIPDEGTNVWYDSMVILKDAENKENAEKYINFLCRPDIAKLNADYLGSASVVTEALEAQDESIRNDPIVNPSPEAVSSYEMFESLAEMAATYERIWSDVTAW